MGGRVGIASKILSRFVQKCATEDDDAFCRLIYRFTVNKMILNINQR